MTAIKTRACKFCHLSFEQPLGRGRGLEFCSLRCRIAQRRRINSGKYRERYAALKAAGVSPSVANKASASKGTFERALAGAQHEEDKDVSAAAE